MKRHLLVVVLLLAVVPACRTAGPPGPAGPPVLPEPLAQYQGELRVLRHQGDERTVKSRPGEPLSGSCDVVVHVRQVVLQKDAARFSLDTVGLPKVRGEAPACERANPGLLLFVEGLVADTPAPDLRARVDEMLQTPEAYLESRGVNFNLEEGEPPVEVAALEVFSGTEERNRGRRVTVWPEALLVVDPWYHDSSGRVRQEGQVEVEVVVGTDGRIYEPKLKTGMGSSHERAVLRVLPLWRFEPARGADGSMATRILVTPILRIF